MTVDSGLVLFESPITRERITVETPLEDNADVEGIRRELVLPTWVDLDDRIVRRAVVGVWAANSSFAGQADTPGPKLFGGIAFRLTCPSTNREGGFRREIKDVDYIVSKKTARPFLEVLTDMHTEVGSAYFHFMTEEDRRFNNLRAGHRYRLRVVVDEEPRTTFVDVFVGRLSFCHRVETGEVLESNAITLSLPLLVLTKLQFITSVPTRELNEHASHRVLGELHKGVSILGMEDKDTGDVAAAFHDHAPGSGGFPAEPILEQTSRDWGLCKTVTMNLRNVGAVAGVLENRGAQRSEIETVVGRMLALAERVDDTAPKRPRFRIKGRAWWEEVDE